MILPTTPQHGLRIVAIGGGTGLSTLLAGLKPFVGAPEDAPSETFETGKNAELQQGAELQDAELINKNLRLESLSAIVTVSDDGGSSGRLRDELNILPPGDIRNCMVALSEDSTLLARLFQYRFPGDGALGGHSFGNLFLAALTSVTGDFVEAVRLSSEVLASKGRIFPATLNDARLVAELTDGTVLRGESVIGRSHAQIEKLRLEPEICLPLPETLAAVSAADIITLGPGSLYTSLLPNLLVARVSDAIAESKAMKIFVCNLMTQPGETDNFTAAAHLKVVGDYAANIVFDCIIVNRTPITKQQAERYDIEGAEQVLPNDELEKDLFDTAIADRARTRIIAADLLDDELKVRHNPAKLARTILDCYSLADA